MDAQLTEAWGVAYFQIIITLLVFAFSIPFIVYQISLPKEILHIINKYMKRSVWLVLSIIIMLFIFALCFIWILHPVRGRIATWQHWAAGLLITSALIFTLLFWVRMLLGSIKKVIRKLEVKIKKDIYENGISLSQKEEILDDLISLGKNSDPGHEKRLVLDALNRLAIHIQRNNDYSGCELEDYLRSFEKIILNDIKPGNDDNFCRSVEILKGIKDRFSEINPKINTDFTLAQTITINLSAEAVKSKTNITAKKILQNVYDNNEAVFEMGLAALEAKKYSIALSALNELEALEEKNRSNEQIHHLLGLLAHFRLVYPAGKRRAEWFLSKNVSDFKPSFGECVQEAIEFFYKTALYDTVEKLTIMQEELYYYTDPDPSF